MQSQICSVIVAFLILATTLFFGCSIEEEDPEKEIDEMWEAVDEALNDARGPQKESERSNLPLRNKYDEMRSEKKTRAASITAARNAYESDTGESPEDLSILLLTPKDGGGPNGPYLKDADDFTMYILEVYSRASQLYEAESSGKLPENLEQFTPYLGDLELRSPYANDTLAGEYYWFNYRGESRVKSGPDAILAYDRAMLADLDETYILLMNGDIKRVSREELVVLTQDERYEGIDFKLPD